MSCTAKHERKTSLELQPNIERLNSWARKWKILLNPQKTVCLTVSRVASPKYVLVMDGIFAREVQHHRHPGVTLSDDGRWSEHLNNICSSSTKRFNILKHYCRKLTSPSYISVQSFALNLSTAPKS